MTRLGCCCSLDHLSFIFHVAFLTSSLDGTVTGIISVLLFCAILLRYSSARYLKRRDLEKQRG